MKRTVSRGRTEKRDRNRRAEACLFLLFFFCFLLCTGLGSVPLSLKEIAAVLTGQGEQSHTNILLFVRLPRVAACALAGGGLAVSGVIIQNVLGNPLAGPNIIGVNAGAGFAVVLCSALFPLSYRLVPCAAFMGALAAMLLIYFLARKTGASRVTLILAGVCVNSMFNSASDVVHTFGDNTLTGTYGFRLGGFGFINGNVLFPAGIVILACILAACLLADELEVLSLGEQVASSVGMNIKIFRFLFLVLASALAGAVVSFAGLLGFVGLLAPHIARRLIGEECRHLLPFSALFGAVFVMLCDLAARTLFIPYEIPTGILLSFIGAPFFLYLLFRQKRRRSHD